MILTKAFSSQKQRELKSIAQKRAKRKARKTTKRIELKVIETAKKTSKLQNIDTFDLSICNESNFEQYSEVTNFLQHFEQRQHLYRKSNLLVLLSKCLCDFAFEWFKIQFEFISLKRFDRILAKAFSEASVRRVSKSSNFQLSTLEVISESIETSSDFEITNARITCKLCKQSFNFNEKLYQHIRNHEILKLVKDSRFSINTINLVRKLEKTSFVSREFFVSFAKFSKSIFESTTTSSITSLEHSNLLLSALKMKSDSTKKLATCRHCKQTFNFKKMLRQHKQKQHAKKSIVNSHFSINAIKSACESIEMLTVNLSFFVSLVIQSNTLFLFANLDIFNSNRFHQNLEKRRFNQIVIFIQHLQHCQQLYCESEVLEWMKIILYDFVEIWFENQSNFIFLHDFSIALTRTFSTAQKFQKIDIQKFSTISSSLLSNALKSICKAKKKSTIISIEDVSKIISKKKVESRFRIAYLFTRLKASRLSFSLNTFVTISETMKNASIQEVACTRATCKQCEQNFDFNKKLFEHINEHKALKSVKNSFFTNSTLKSLCEIEKKSFDICSSSSHESLTFATSKNLMSKTETFLRFDSSKCSSLQLSTLESASKSMKKFSIHQIVCARICKRCKQSFNFNNKFHEHIREHHARKSVQNLNLKIFASESTCKIKKKSTFICSFASFVSQKSSILFATSRSRIFYFATIFRSMSSIRLNFSIASHEISSKRAKIAAMLFTRDFTSKRIKIVAFNCSLTFSISSSRTSVSKFYFTMNDLSRMFHEKFKSFDLQQYHNHRFSRQSFDVRQSRFASSKKSHLTIENLFEIFDEKFKKKSLFQNQNNVFFRAFSDQMQIIVYFKSTVNQKSSISQISKNSKSKISKQHMFAKSIRTVFSEILFEKSIELSYKMLEISEVNSKTLFFIFILLRLLSASAIGRVIQ